MSGLVRAVDHDCVASAVASPCWSKSTFCGSGSRRSKLRKSVLAKRSSCVKSSLDSEVLGEALRLARKSDMLSFEREPVIVGKPRTIVNQAKRMCATDVGRERVKP